MTDLDALFGVDPDDPEQRLSDQLAESDEGLLDDLIAIRRARKLSQAELGKLMGVGQSAVARIEGGERDPHLSTLRRYAHALGVLIRHEVVPGEVERLRQQAADRASVGARRTWPEYPQRTDRHLVVSNA